MSYLDNVRYQSDLALASAIPIRLYTVDLIVNTWSGSRAGLGTKTQTVTPLTNANGVPLHVKQVTEKDIGLHPLLRDQDLALGPFVFPYNTGTVTGGTHLSTFSPTTPNAEMFFQVTGHSMPTGGRIYTKIYDVADKSVMFRIYVRSAATQIV